MVRLLQIRISIKATVIAALLACLGTAIPALSEDELRIGGVGASMETMKLMGQAFEKTRKGAKVRIFPSLGTAGAIKALVKNAIDVGIVAREFSAEERRLGLTPIPFARSPFVFVAHRNVGISNITTDQLVKIFEGTMTAWPDGTRVRIILRPSSDTDTLIAKRISPKLATAIEGAGTRPGIATALTDQDLTDIVEKVPGAFGFSCLTLIKAEERNVKVFSFNGVKPGAGSLANGAYPLWKPFAIVLRKGAPPVAHDFLRFLKSPEGRRIVEDKGNLVID